MVRLLVLALLVAAVTPTATAQILGTPPPASLGGPSLPDGFYIEDAADASFIVPVAVAFLPGGRMLVVQKNGLVRVVQNGVLLEEPFLDLRDEVLDHHDRGMLGIAVDPAFEVTRRVFFSYTVDHESTSDAPRTDAYARVIRVEADADDLGRADLTTRLTLIGETFATGIPSCYFSHTIGTLVVGADGTLLVGAGEGASYNQMDPGGLYPTCFGPGKLDASEDIGAFRSQRVESLAGKVLRVDPETGLGLPSNPFYTGDPADTASKVWALGLRNPYRFSIAPDGSTNPADGRPGTLYIGEVGWTEWEELNVARGGENFGWPCYEGPEEHGLYQIATPATNGCGTTPTGTLTDAAYRWNHTVASRSVPPGRIASSFIGGAIYEGDRYPAAYAGRLFYGDYVRGWTASAALDAAGDPVDDATFGTGTGTLVSYAYDPFSRYLHMVDVWNGRILRLRHTGEAPNSAPVVRATASPTSGGAGLRVQFSSFGSFDPDGDAVTFLWELGDGRVSDDPAPLVTYEQPGTYDATLTLSDGVEASSATVQVRVREGGRPSIQIAEVTRTARPRVGESVALAATVSDPDQSAASLAVRWTVSQIHEDHAHPDVFTADGATATFNPPEHGVPGEVVYYRVRAEVRDDTGLESVAETALFIDSGPLSVDATDGAAPISREAVANIERLVDGTVPDPGTGARRFQVKTPSLDASEDVEWLGLEFDAPERLHALHFVEGRHEGGGGWFEALGVEVRQSGVWRDVTDLRFAPAYRANDGQNYDAYDLTFAPITADAIRIIGPPGGPERYVTAAELRAFVLREPFGPLPGEWTSADVGDVAAAGQAGWADGVFTVEGSGEIWGGADAFHFIYQDLPPAGEFVARVDDLQGESEWSKAGLLVRESADAPAAYLGVLVSMRGTHVQVRRQSGDETEGIVDRWGETAPRWLRITRDFDVLTVSVSEDGVAWETVTTDTLSLGASPVAGLAVSAADFGEGRLARATFDAVSLTEAPTSSEWVARDVGTPPAPGAFLLDGDTFVIRGGGDIWGDQDRFHLASREMPGDGTLLVRVTDLDGQRDWTKAGLVLRATDAPGAPYVGLFVSKLGVHLQFRAEVDGPSAGPRDLWGPFEPVWLRLDRAGTTVAAFGSLDGVRWRPVGTASVAALDGPLVAGLAVSAGDAGDGLLATARFESADVFPSSSVLIPPLDVTADDPIGFGIDRVFPNPARDALTVRATTAAEGTHAVELLDTLGRRVSYREVQAAAGVADVAFDVSGLPAGTYLLRLRDLATGETETTRVTVAR